MIKSIKIGKIEVSPVGIGTFPFDEEVWGSISEKKAVDLLIEAYKNGVNYFNSAFYYGKGRCESILGKAVRRMDRDKVIVSTKVGTEFGDFSLSKERINKSIKSVLTRMQLDYIDVFILHKPDKNTPIEESIETILNLREKGLIHYIGLSNFPASLAEKVVKIAPIEVYEFYFSMLTQKIGRKVLRFCTKYNITTTPYKVIERGILSSSFLESDELILNINRLYENPYTTEVNMAQTKKLIKKLNEYAKNKGITLAQLAVSWTLHQDGVTNVLIGIRSEKHLLEDLEAVEIELSDNEIENINKILQENNELDI